MEIEFNTGGIPDFGGSQSIARKSTTPPAASPVSLSSTDSLKNQMSSLSDVRPDKVAKARDLVSDPDYPSDDVLGKVAGKLASHISGGTSE